MTIFILHESPEECAKLLDDKSLDKMIKDVAQVLCNTHYINLIVNGIGMSLYDDQVAHIPLSKNFHKTKKQFSEWVDWTRDCVANYDYMVELLDQCVYEKDSRFQHIYNKSFLKIVDVAIFMRNHRPELPIHPFGLMTPVPIVTPKKYIICENSIKNVVESYRNYYRAKVADYFNKKYDTSEWDKIGWIGNIGSLYTKREMPEFLIPKDINSEVIPKDIRTTDFPLDEDHGA